MRSPPLIVWRTCHQTETHSARRSLHKYWRTQKKRESTFFLGWMIPAGRRKINTYLERINEARSFLLTRINKCVNFSMATIGRTVLR